MISKRIKKSAEKKVSKRQQSCYSVHEAHCVFSSHITGAGSAGPNGRNIPSNESFNIRWRYIAKKELSANMYGDRKVYFVSVL